MGERGRERRIGLGQEFIIEAEQGVHAGFTELVSLLLFMLEILCIEAFVKRERQCTCD